MLTEDKLFATLDPVVRKIALPENRECLLVDTVGFIRKLPHQLVEAFQSTLEEALDADLLVVVSDASSPRYQEERDVVFQVLSQLGAAGKPVIEALNKADQMEWTGQLEPREGILISARTGMGLDRLRKAIADKVSALRKTIELVIPYDKGAALSLLHEKGQMLQQEYLPQGVRVQCQVDAALYQRVLSMVGREEAAPL